MCCAPETQCCVGPGGVPIDCCLPGEKCVAGVCNPITEVTYSGSGGGTGISSSGAKSLLRLNISGTGSPISPNGFGDTSDIAGNLQAFNFATRTLIGSVSYSAVQGSLSPTGDVVLTGLGRARVNGIVMNITFFVTKIAGVTSFEIRSADSGTLLAGGTGEPGLADLGLSIVSA